ncbi:MAG: hypothetical protein JSS89_03555 [Bacteroidetes bacterium]|nr:hypothetical protein [Bacteroidota bacterium]
MLLVIPAIDLTQGHCARCILGEPGTEELYRDFSAHPIDLVKLWRRENAKCVHVTDLDSINGHDHVSTLQTVMAMQRAVDIPIQLVSLQRNVDIYRSLLEAGVYRVAIHGLAITDPDGVQELIEDFTASRVIFGIRADEGDVDFGEEIGMVTDEEYIRQVYELGGRRLIYTEKKWEGGLTGQDADTIRRVAAVSKIRITTAGGIATPQQLWDLEQFVPLGVDSVVIGRALYENRFPCQHIWRQAEALIEPQIHANDAMGGQQSSISTL